MRTIYSNQMMDGGSGITNFGTAQLAQYEQAVAEFNSQHDEPVLEISDVPMERNYSDNVDGFGEPVRHIGADPKYSLHKLKNVSISTFWRLFDSFGSKTNWQPSLADQLRNASKGLAK